MKKIFSLLIFSIFVINCSSGDNLKPGEMKDLKDDSGKFLGTYIQITETDSVTRFDTDGDKKPNKGVYQTSGVVTKVEYYKDGDYSKMLKRVNYSNGEPASFEVFDSEGNNGVLKEGTISNGIVTSVDFIESKKRVFYKEDGSTDKVEDIK